MTGYRRPYRLARISQWRAVHRFRRARPAGHRETSRAARAGLAELVEWRARRRALTRRAPRRNCAKILSRAGRCGSTATAPPLAKVCWKAAPWAARRRIARWQEAAVDGSPPLDHLQSTARYAEANRSELCVTRKNHGRRHRRRSPAGRPQAHLDARQAALHQGVSPASQRDRHPPLLRGHARSADRDDRDRDAARKP